MAERVPVTLTVNGARHELALEPRRTLLDTLREELKLTGAKPGCGMGAVRRLHRAAGRRSGL